MRLFRKFKMSIFILSLLCRNVLWVGRHRLARKRRKSRVVLAAVLAPAAVFFAVAGDVGPFAVPAEAKPVIGNVAPSHLEIISAESNLPHSAAGMGGRDSQPVASRYHVRSRFLPVGLASEQGLQVRTILASRAISVTFPEIHEIGGVRADPLPWHPLGLALDVMIPNPESPHGIELGNEIVAYVLRNADRL